MNAISPVFQTELLYVMYDTGETVPFLAEMAYQLDYGREFRFIAEGSAVNSFTIDNCKNNQALYNKIMARRITFSELGLQEVIDDKTWPRERKISKESKSLLTSKIAAKVVLTGAASRMQKQVATHIKGAKKVVFIDQFDYDKNAKSFETLERVVSKADLVLYPSKYTRNLFSKGEVEARHSEVSGTPTLQTWIEQIKKVELHADEIFMKLGFEKSKGGPIIAFMDAYDSNPEEDNCYSEIISPLFKELAVQLEQEGFRVVIQPHPKMSRLTPQKVSTPELLAVCDYVIGYNSSTVFNSLVLSKKAVYLIPERVGRKTFSHFSIDKGYASAIIFKEKAEVLQKLLELLKRMGKEPAKDVFALEEIPRDSIKKIDEIIYSQLIAESKTKSS